jgi:hypothetical protein
MRIGRWGNRETREFWNEDCGLNRRKNQRVIGLWNNQGIRTGSQRLSLEVFLTVSRNLFESNGMEVNERVFIKAITTCPSAKSHFIDVSLVYWKTFAHLQTACIINSAKLLSRQHGANKNERATSSALMAFPFS